MNRTNLEANKVIARGDGVSHQLEQNINSMTVVLFLEYLAELHKIMLNDTPHEIVSLLIKNRSSLDRLYESYIEETENIRLLITEHQYCNKLHEMHSIMKSQLIKISN
jgi:hypothetical protein